jgi:glycosyltransferase involved in cell wall biosynthesis
VVLPMPCPEIGGGAAEWRSGAAPRVLWIGRIVPVKRPDRLLDLAEACPDLSFDLVGPGDDGYARRILERAARAGNVTVHGGVPRDRLGPFYRQATSLLCTSDREGFPNTFLEAWSHGLPVVSTVDPDGLIAERRLGGTGHDLPALAGALRALLGSPARWQAASEAARRYYVEHHSVERALPRFEQLFVEVAGRAGTGAA